MKPIVGFLGTAAFLFNASVASAALLPAFQITGNVGLSVDGVGSTSSAVGNIQAAIPVGAKIERAFLYSASTLNENFSLSTFNTAGITFGGVPITNFDTLVGIPGYATGRADITSVLANLVTGAISSDFFFAVTEGIRSGSIDGEVLAIAYSLPSLAEGSVIFLDGGQEPGGETTTVNFASPIADPNDPNFRAELGLGISFSAGGTQVSTVKINGSTLTDVAGGFDDGALANGALITVGGLGNSAQNSNADELYSLTPYLKAGDTSFSIFTNNPSFDDNIFFSSLYVTGKAAVGMPAVPEPATWAMMLVGFGLIGGAMRRRSALHTAVA